MTDQDIAAAMRRTPDAVAPAPARRPPSYARCAHCGHAEISYVPTFSAGAGLSNRPLSEDVYCHRCGEIGVLGIVDTSHSPKRHR